MKTENQTTSSRSLTLEDLLQRDSRFRYMLLSRLQSDCEYYLNYGNRHAKSLWAGDEEAQIEIMIGLHNSFEEDKKPEWLTMEQIMEYRKEMVTPQEQ